MASVPADARSQCNARASPPNMQRCDGARAGRWPAPTDRAEESGSSAPRCGATAQHLVAGWIAGAGAGAVHPAPISYDSPSSIFRKGKGPRVMESVITGKAYVLGD